MRKLMLFTIGFAAGCAVAVYFLFGIWMVVAAAVFAALFFLFMFVRPDDRKKIVAIIMLGAAIGSLWTYAYDLLYAEAARKLDGLTENATIEATDFISENDYGFRGIGKVKINGVSYNVQYSIEDDIDVYPGDKISGSFRFRFTGYHGEDSPTYHQGKGILLLAYAQAEVTHKALNNIPAKYFAVQLRHAIISKINAVFSEDQAGFACSLLLGDTSDLTYEDDAALKVSGIRHIVAVSGLHVSILLSFAYVFSRGNRYAHAAIGLPLLLVFAAVAGFTPSIVRACVMQGIMILGILLDNEYDAPTSLSFAVLLIIATNPLSITSVSFQLSVGCVIGIMLFSRKIHAAIMRTKLGPAKGKSFKSRIIRSYASSVSVTLSTMVFTLPISAWYFGSVSVVSVLTNFLTLWIVSICFYGVIISTILSFLFPPLAVALAWLVSWPMRLILMIAKLLSKIPFAAVSVHNPYFLAWIIFCYVLLAVFVIIKKKKAFLLVCMAIVSFVICTIFAFAEPRLDNYRMTVLDVGQGQCVILQSKDSCYIVDCGGDYSTGAADLAAQTLRSAGIGCIDGLILTHFDADHSAGTEYLIAQLEIERIYGPDADEDLAYSYRKVRTELVLDCGVGQITIFPGEKGKTGNESSLCILFQAEDCDILITGDRNNAGESYLIDNFDIPQLDVLVAGHHGSDSSTSLYLLQRTLPKTVVISVGENNGYGHPNEAVLRRLERINAVVWRTDQDGTIIIRG